MNPIDLSEKGALAAKAKEILSHQIQNIQNQLDELRSAGAGESKSSAGDKYETQREMIKQNQDMLSSQLKRTQTLLYRLNAVPIGPQKIIQEGALVQLSTGKMWISVSLGKIEMNDQDYQLISRDSPLFQALKDKKVGDLIEFRGNRIFVEYLI